MKIIMVRMAPKGAVLVEVPAGWACRQINPITYWVEAPDGEGGTFGRDAIMDAVASGKTLREFFAENF